MKRNSIILFVLVLTAYVAMAGGQKQTAEQKKMLYYMAPVLIDEFQTGSKLMVEKFGKEQGFEVRSLNANNSAQIQIDQMDDAIAQKPTAIILNAVDGSALTASVNKAKNEGIPVLVYSRTIKDTTIVFTSVTGAMRYGEMGATECVKFLKKKYNEEKGSIIELMGDTGDMYTVLIDQGFRESLAKYPNISVVAKDAAGWDPTVTARILDDQLTAGNKFDIIFIHADFRVTAITPVLQNHGYKMGDVLIIGTDGMPSGLDQIRNGWMIETVGGAMKNMVWGLFQFMDKVLAKEPIAAGEYDVKGIKGQLKIEKWGPTLYLPGVLVTKDNVNDPELWGNIKIK
jgi:ribose transport system substrate-binding protein